MDLPRLYIGNGPYCYANSTAMMLAFLGENITPSLIEVISGVGLGATVEKSGFLYLNNQRLEPDLGIVSSLNILGFTAETFVSKTGDEFPFEELREKLQSQPIILGPVDMGYLMYNPHHNNMHGGDHYIFAYKIDGNQIYLHDPAGYPHVFLDRDDLKLAWQAKQISYRQGYYRYTTNVKRVKSPSIEEIYIKAMQRFVEIYTIGEKETSKDQWSIGKDALLNTAERLRKDQVSQGEKDNFVFFVFQLGAKRALDYAEFFDLHNPELADLKRKQAEILGHTHTHAVSKNWEEVANQLEQLADIEELFKETLLKK
jgi:hypothetical protein